MRSSLLAGWIVVAALLGGGAAGTKARAQGAALVSTNLTEVPGLLFEVWTAIPGTTVSSLTEDPHFLNDVPDFQALATAADSRTVYANDSNDNYGARLSGWLVPQESGTYELFLRSSDASELWLSATESTADLVEIADEPTCCQPFQEPGAEQTSGPITLLGGSRYAIEVLLKAGTNTDYVQVAWRKAGDETPAALLKPIPGEFLRTQWEATNGPPILTSRPGNRSVGVGETAVLTGLATVGVPPIRYQWSLGGTNIAGATNSSLTITNFALTNTGIYTLTATNTAGKATAIGGLFPRGALYIEAEDFNYGHGQFVTNQSIGLNGPYLGGAYRGLGTAADAGVDWHVVSTNAGTFRPATGVNAGQENLQPDWVLRGDFVVQVNNVIATNTAGDWYDYTRQFPVGARNYNVLARAASAGTNINLRFDEVTAGVTTTNQLLTKLGEIRPGRGTAGTNQYEFFPLVDTAGKMVTLTNWSGEKSFRVTVLPGGAANLDYYMFVPVGSVTNSTGFTSVTRNGNSLTLAWNTGTLYSADTVIGPWSIVPNQKSPMIITIGPGPRKFYRLQ